MNDNDRNRYVFNGFYNNSPMMNIQANIGGNNIYESHFVNRQIQNPNYNPYMPAGSFFIGSQPPADDPGRPIATVMLLRPSGKKW